jgi:Zn finger protein HypA/HybF involved in hydrogenase expression
MKKYSLECTYCGHIWGEDWVGTHSVIVCPKCKDRKIRVKDNRNSKVDYYAGSVRQSDDDEGYDPWNR